MTTDAIFVASVALLSSGSCFVIAVVLLFF